MIASLPHLAMVRARLQRVRGRVLDLWAAGLQSPAIGATVGIPAHDVLHFVSRARIAGDARATRRCHPIAIAEPRLRTQARATEIIATVSAETGIRQRDLRGRSREKRVVAARRLAAERLRAAGFHPIEIGILLERDRSTVLHMLALTPRAKRRAAA